MQITVSSDRKLYFKASDGSLASSIGAFHSQSMTLPDDTSIHDVRIARYELMEEMDMMVDLDLFVNGVITSEALMNRKRTRHERYAALKEALGHVD